jgi:predicted metal-dependent hydrolase
MMIVRWRLVRRRPVRKSAKKKSVRRTNTREYAEYKEIARERAAERLAHFNEFYKHTYARVSIKNQKTRWGSCSSKGNLNFHYKIALLEPHLVDYIVVHELCHLQQMNHSKAFWDLVAQTIPDHATRRRELRNGKIRPGR